MLFVVKPRDLVRDNRSALVVPKDDSGRRANAQEVSELMDTDDRRYVILRVRTLAS